MRLQGHGPYAMEKPVLVIISRSGLVLFPWFISPKVDGNFYAISLGLRGTQGLAVCDKPCMIRQVFVAPLMVKDGVHVDQKRGVRGRGMGARAQVSSCCRVLAQTLSSSRILDPNLVVHMVMNVFDNVRS